MIRLNAIAIGPIAAEILNAHHELEVLAVFEKSFYLMSHGGLVCLGSDDIGRGPINVPLGQAGAIDWRAIGVDVDTEGRSHHDRLTVGDGLSISLAGAEPWHPPAWRTFDTAATARGLAALRALARPRLPDEGLAPLVLADQAKSPPTLAAKAAAPQVRDLHFALPRALARDAIDDDIARALTLLLGLGPGLTPSGDDLIGGMMLALTALGRTGLRDAMWDALTPELGDLTTEISAMHLSAAADGLGAEAVHGLANAILAGDAGELPVQIDRISRIGHCSGWDTAAGFALMIDAALHNGNGEAAHSG